MTCVVSMIIKTEALQNALRMCESVLWIWYVYWMNESRSWRMRYGYMDQWNLFFFSKKEKKNDISRSIFTMQRWRVWMDLMRCCLKTVDVMEVGSWDERECKEKSCKEKKKRTIQHKIPQQRFKGGKKKETKKKENKRGTKRGDLQARLSWGSWRLSETNRAFDLKLNRMDPKVTFELTFGLIHSNGLIDVLTSWSSTTNSSPNHKHTTRSRVSRSHSVLIDPWHRLTPWKLFGKG